MARERRTTRRRRGRTEEEPEESLQKEEAPVAEEGSEEESEEVMEPEAFVDRKRTARTLGDSEVKSGGTADCSLAELFEGMADGQEMVVTRHGDEWRISSLVAKLAIAKGKKGRLPKDFSKNIHTTEYWDWLFGEWQVKTYEEKIKYANKLDAKWEPHDHMQTEMMRVVPAVCEKLGIEKYKPEYTTRAERAVAREKAMAGLPY